MEFIAMVDRDAAQVGFICLLRSVGMSLCVEGRVPKLPPKMGASGRMAATAAMPLSPDELRHGSLGRTKKCRPLLSYAF